MACRVRFNVAVIMMMPDENIGRNALCPRGSGQKYTHCCLRTRPVPEESLWARQQEAYQQLISALMSMSKTDSAKRS